VNCDLYHNIDSLPGRWVVVAAMWFSQFAMVLALKEEWYSLLLRTVVVNPIVHIMVAVMKLVFFFEGFDVYYRKLSNDDSDPRLRHYMQPSLLLCTNR
jgi:hypothetical protein